MGRPKKRRRLSSTQKQANASQVAPQKATPAMSEGVTGSASRPQTPMTGKRSRSKARAAHTPLKRRRIEASQVAEVDKQAEVGPSGTGEAGTEATPRTRTVSGPARAVPRILRCVFSERRVCTLLELLHVLGEYPVVKKRMRKEAKAVPTLLMQAADVESERTYRSRSEEEAARKSLVQELLSVPREADGATADDVLGFFEADLPLHDVVQRSIAFAVRASSAKKGTHTIARGYSVGDRSSGGALSGFGQGLRCYFPNTTVTMLEKKEWECMVNILGSAVVYFLFTQCLVFAGIGSGNRSLSSYVQVTGYNVGDFVRGRSLLVPLANRKKLEPRPASGVGLRNSAGEKESDGSELPLTDEEVKIALEDLASNGVELLRAAGLSGGNPGRKRKRISKAERKKEEEELAALSREDFFSQAAPAFYKGSELDLAASGEVEDGDEDEDDEEEREAETSVSVSSKPQVILQRTDAPGMHTRQWNMLALSRHLIFYCNPNMQHYGLPTSHVLNQLSGPTTNNARKLLTAIFTPPKLGGRGKAKSSLGLPLAAVAKPKHRPRIRRVLLPMVPLLKGVIKRHQQQTYKHIIDAVCPLPLEGKQAVTHASAPMTQELPSRQRPSYRQLTKHFTPNAKVGLFLKTVLGRLFRPLHVVLGHCNIPVVHRSIDALVSLRRHETLPLARIMEGVRVSYVPWLQGHGPTPAILREFKRKQMALLLFWIFNEVLIPLLRVHFYCTESGMHHNKVFYFRKSLWKGLTNLAVRELTERMFEPLAVKQVQAIVDTRPFGYSYVRVLPKANGIRPIVNLGRRPRMEKNAKGHTYSINLTLQKALSIMRYEKAKEPAIVGSSVLGMDDMYRKVLSFVQKWKAQKRPKLYFATADIRKCFDTIDQEQLFRTLQGNFLTEPEYMLRRYFKVLSCHGRIVQRFEESAGTLEDFTDFEAFVQERLAEGKDRNVCLTDRVYYHTTSREDVLGLLHEHIFNNLIKHGKTFYRQTQGIAQGSVLSTLLCNIHYGAMENSEFSHLPTDLPSCKADGKDGIGLLMRFTDDFFYLTTSKAAASTFVQSMHNGLAQYGCQANKAKTRVSFGLELADGSTARRCANDALQWCGLNFSIKTLEVTPDYSRYFGTYMRETISVNTLKSPGEQFRRKMIQFLKPKCHALMLDTQINHLDTVCSTLFRIFIFTAVKFHCHASALPRKPALNPGFFWDTILDIIDHLHYFVRAQLITKQAKESGCTCPVTKRDIVWMGLKAFRAVISKKQTRYPTITASIDHRLATLRSSQPLSPHVVAAIELEMLGPAALLF